MTISRGSLSFPSYLHGLISEVVTIALVLDISASKSWIKHSVSQDCILAHLSRRLIGELIVYRSSRRPCVRPSVRASVRSHLQTGISLQPVGRLE